MDSNRVLTTATTSTLTTRLGASGPVQQTVLILARFMFLSLVGQVVVDPGTRTMCDTDTRRGSRPRQLCVSVSMFAQDNPSSGGGGPSNGLDSTISSLSSLIGSLHLNGTFGQLARSDVSPCCTHTEHKRAREQKQIELARQS